MHKQGPPSYNEGISRALHNKSIHYNSDNVKSHIAESLGAHAHKAIMLEIETTPKPGLVDRSGNGCHSDMTFETFTRSANALAAYWNRPAAAGLNGMPPERVMEKLRPHGKVMENAMLAATGGINTHKGLIYHLSLLLYGAGHALSKNEPLTAERITHYASMPVAGSIKKELEPLREKNNVNLSNGEKLFLKYGVTGARGEAENGFPSVLHGLQTLQAAHVRGASPNDASLAALLSIMCRCEDSNVIHRAGYAYWNGTYKKIVTDAQEAFDPSAPDYEIIYDLERHFLPHRVSAGGAADLLCCSLFVNIVTIPTCQH